MVEHNIMIIYHELKAVTPKDRSFYRVYITIQPILLYSLTFYWETQLTLYKL